MNYGERQVGPIMDPFEIKDSFISTKQIYIAYRSTFDLSTRPMLLLR